MKTITLFALLLTFTALAQQPEQKPGQAAQGAAAPAKDHSNRPPLKPPSEPWERPKLKLIRYSF